MKKSKKIDTSLDPELVVHSKRKSLIAALGRVKEWTNEKKGEENLRKIVQNGRSIQISSKSIRDKRGNKKSVEEIILGGSGPSTLLQAAKERNFISRKKPPNQKLESRIEKRKYISDKNSRLTIVPVEQTDSDDSVKAVKNVEKNKEISGRKRLLISSKKKQSVFQLSNVDETRMKKVEDKNNRHFYQSQVKVCEIFNILFI